MGALPSDDLTNLNPVSTREWLQHLNRRFDVLESSIANDRETMIGFMEKTNEWIKCHDVGLVQREKMAERHDEKINQLEKKVNAWNMGNTVAAIIAAIMGFFGLKGS